MSFGDQKISVAMATCNGEAFLEQQLDSIFSQSVPPDEIVICDDRSDDGTVSIAEAWRRRHPGAIRLLRNPVRLGSSRNFERAISEASGDVIFLADQDDVWLPGRVEQMCRLLSSPETTGGVFCDSAVVDRELRDTGVGHWECRGFSAAALEAARRTDDGVFRLFLKRVPAAGHDMAFRAALRPLLLPFPALPECHDTWIGLLLAALGKWEFTSEKLTLFRQHETNASRSGRRPGWIGQWREAKRSIRSGTFAWNAELFRRLIERLGDHPPAETAALLRDRMEHSLTRSAMACGWLRRLPLIGREVRNGRYFRYGRGWKSVVQDLLLQGPPGSWTE